MIRTAITPPPKAERTAECEYGEHRLCAGNCELRLRQDDVPVMTLYCGCTCHNRRTPKPPPVVGRDGEPDDGRVHHQSLRKEAQSP